MRKLFTLEYWLDDGWYIGRLREIPGVFSQAESLPELEENIRDAYHLMLTEKALPDVKVQTKTIALTDKFAVAIDQPVECKLS